MVRSCSGAWAAVAAIGLWACDEETVPRPPPEVCDDGIDNDGDDLIDCDDENCGGLPCQQKGTTDTGGTGKPPVVEIVLGEDCCDFTYGSEDCPQKLIGSVSFVNRDPEVDGTFDVSCDVVNNDPVIEWKVVGGNNQTPFLVNLPLAANSTVTVEGFFVCTPGINQNFTTTCHLHAEVGSRQDNIDHPVRATRVGR